MVWDIPTRLLHWFVALPTLINFFSEGGETLHRTMGYVSCAGILLRFVYGVVAKNSANFHSWPFAPTELIDYISDLLKGKAACYTGHNPLSAVVYVLIWYLVMLLGISGYLLGTDLFWGSEWLEEWHLRLNHVLQGLVGLHFVGMTIDAVKFKRLTWLAMITGSKTPWHRKAQEKNG